MGFAGEPVPPLIRRGEIIKKNSYTPLSEHCSDNCSKFILIGSNAYEELIFHE